MSGPRTPVSLPDPPALIGVVCGSASATTHWQSRLEAAKAELGTRSVIALHEDRPVNQALGLLLMWSRIRDRLHPGDGALLAFVFGRGTRAAPLTEAEAGQKPAIVTFGRGAAGRPLPMVELALRAFAPVESHLRRSGFDGVVVKWGDEVIVPDRDLTAPDPRLATADIVRFVSMQPPTEHTAAHKDWMSVSSSGEITAFVPRRPLGELLALPEAAAARVGVNLGSIALSRVLLDPLLDEFANEVNDRQAVRAVRPDLDPQLFTALTVARIGDPTARRVAWASAVAASPALARLDQTWPDLVGRLRRVLDRFEMRHGRAVRMVALDLGQPFWGDVGQHQAMRAFVQALNDTGPRGEHARALAGLHGSRDENGNLLVGESYIAPGAAVRGSVLIDAKIYGVGEVVDSVLIGTEVADIRAEHAFDLYSTVRALKLSKDAGTYKVVSLAPVAAGPGERWTTLFSPRGPAMFGVHEDHDLRDAATYGSRILDNPLSFAAAYDLMVSSSPDAVHQRREQAREQVRAELRRTRPGLP